MPRDAGPTRESLIDAGLRLFADQGINAPLSAVIAAAGQKNASALHYHFGGREGLLDAIVEVTNARIERERRDMLDELTGRDDVTVRDLVRTMIEPWAALLDEQRGRWFLAVLSQFDHRMDHWEDDPSRSPPEAMRNILWLLEVFPDDIPGDIQRERITQLLSMVAEALGMRARNIDRGGRPRLDHAAFVGNLVEMMVGALNAPAPVRAS
jgi:AcrR family transcriptional regulator